MKGKLISFNPKMKDGAQESFNFNNKDYYVFIVTAQINGEVKVGDAFSTSTSPKWKLNEECEITVEENEKSTSGNKFRIKFDENKSNFSGRGFGKPIPERMEIITQSSFSTAIHYIEILDAEERKAIFEKYGPDDAFINFSKRIAKEIIKTAKELEAEN
jgi:hypothetical protein